MVDREVRGTTDIQFISPTDGRILEEPTIPDTTPPRTVTIHVPGIGEIEVTPDPRFDDITRGFPLPGEGTSGAAARRRHGKRRTEQTRGTPPGKRGMPGRH